jgi:hypothetical protein
MCFSCSLGGNSTPTNLISMNRTVFFRRTLSISTSRLKTWYSGHINISSCVFRERVPRNQHSSASRYFWSVPTHIRDVQLLLGLSAQYRCSVRRQASKGPSEAWFVDWLPKPPSKIDATWVRLFQLSHTEKDTVTLGHAFLTSQVLHVEDHNLFREQCSHT